MKVFPLADNLGNWQPLCCYWLVVLSLFRKSIFTPKFNCVNIFSLKCVVSVEVFNKELFANVMSLQTFYIKKGV